jgi:hypothetical protein
MKTPGGRNSKLVRNRRRNVNAPGENRIPASTKELSHQSSFPSATSVTSVRCFPPSRDCRPSIPHFHRRAFAPIPTPSVTSVTPVRCFPRLRDPPAPESPHVHPRVFATDPNPPPSILPSASGIEIRPTRLAQTVSSSDDSTGLAT